MNISVAERRQIENEMIFRRKNENIGDDLDMLDAMHIEDHDEHLISDPKDILHFKCECSDENCDERIPLNLGMYRKIHEDRDTFIVRPSHQVDVIEKVIRTESTYSVVKKNNSTPEPGDKLNVTTINN